MLTTILILGVDLPVRWSVEFIETDSLNTYCDFSTFENISVLFYVVECFKDYLEVLISIMEDDIITVTEMIHLTASFSFLTGIVFQDNVLSFMPGLRLPEDNDCLQFEYSDFYLLKVYHHVAVVPTIIATILSGFLIVEIIAVEFCHNKSFKKFANKELFKFKS